MEQREKVRCPYCGYRMPVEAAADAVSRGIYVKCKGRGCGRVFEIRRPEPKKETR